MHHHMHVPALQNIMKFQHFFKVHQISSNLQNILESSSETCMWNLSLFREVKFFHRKMLTVPALEISWNFNIFSKFTKFHQTCRTYWNHHQKHACEIWAHSEKLTYFKKNADSAGPLKYHEISTFFQSSPNFIKLAEHIGIIIRNMHVKFQPIQRSFFHRKMLTVPALKYHEISTFFQNQIHLAEFHQTCRTYWNHHQKHACEIWAYSEK